MLIWCVMRALQDDAVDEGRVLWANMVASVVWWFERISRLHDLLQT